jgi:hypothetical protein
MDAASLAAGLAAARTGQVQLALAAKMLKMNAEAAQSVVQLLEASQANLQQLAAAGPGLGTNLDISV